MDIDLKNQLLQQLDGQTQCDHFGKNVKKFVRMVRDLFGFSVFFMWTILHLENGD